MTQEEQYYLDSLIKNALTISTDEMEGLQVIDLESLNLCAVDYAKSDVTDDGQSSALSDLSILDSIYDDDLVKLITTPPDLLPDILPDIDTDDRVIIEFADATIKDPNPVIYDIKVNPGDAITDDTIIGSVMQNGQMKPIKSIFLKGSVSSINEGTDYLRLYPSKCNRHIVLENTLIGTGNDFNISEDILALNDSFMDEGILYLLITNNMCYSLLPYVLSHRYRGVYTRSRTWTPAGLYIEGKWYLDSSDLSFDNTEVSTFIKNSEFKNSQQYNTTSFVFDKDNEKLPTGLAIFDVSIMLVLYDIQDDFGAKIVAKDVTKSDMKSWRKRAKKKKKRKAVKREIKAKTDNSVNSIKKAPSPYKAILNESKRLLDARDEYIKKCIEIYKNKDKLPLCQYDPDYTDCKFLVSDNISSKTLTLTKKFDSDFTYLSIGDSDTYYNYYFSVLSHINLLNDSDKYSKEFYDLITDIINKRLIVEGVNSTNMMINFMNLFNCNVAHIFNLFADSRYNTTAYVTLLFNSFEGLVNIFILQLQIQQNNNLRDKFKSAGLGDEAIANAGTNTNMSEYSKVYLYINSLYKFDEDEDSDGPNEVISLLATMYSYIKSYGTGSTNPYKDFVDTNGKYGYLALVQEESKRICEFWDKILDLYYSHTMDNCIKLLNDLATRMTQYAEWPLPTEINIDNVNYKHYLFENIYPLETTDDIEIDVGDYSFPDHVDFPEIPDHIDVDEGWALDQMNNHDMGDFDDPDAMSFLKPDYWRKYFSLATLICLVPSFWNCGLDIPPFIQMIPLPCIFIAITSVYIPLFGMLIVFGISIRGMYPWPIILYLNVSNLPINILTPLVAILEQLKNAFYAKLDKIELVPIQELVNMYIKKLNNEINDIKKENIKLNNFKKVIQSMPIPKALSVKETFSKIVDPSIDTRLRITRIEALAKKQRVKK